MNHRADLEDLHTAPTSVVKKEKNDHQLFPLQTGQIVIFI